MGLPRLTRTRRRGSAGDGLVGVATRGRRALDGALAERRPVERIEELDQTPSVHASAGSDPGLDDLLFDPRETHGDRLVTLRAPRVGEVLVQTHQHQTPRAGLHLIADTLDAHLADDRLMVGLPEHAIHRERPEDRGPVTELIQARLLEHGSRRALVLVRVDDLVLATTDVEDLDVTVAIHDLQATDREVPLLDDPLHVELEPPVPRSGSRPPEPVEEVRLEVVIIEHDAHDSAIVRSVLELYAPVAPAPDAGQPQEDREGRERSSTDAEDEVQLNPDSRGVREDPRAGEERAQADSDRDRQSDRGDQVLGDGRRPPLGERCPLEHRPHEPPLEREDDLPGVDQPHREHPTEVVEEFPQHRTTFLSARRLEWP